MLFLGDKKFNFVFLWKLDNVKDLIDLNYVVFLCDLFQVVSLRGGVVSNEQFVYYDNCVEIVFISVYGVDGWFIFEEGNGVD